MERVLRELSMEQSWIMIRSGTELELIATSSPYLVARTAGEGQFSVDDDREKLAPVLQKALMRKLNHLLRAQDLVGYRVLLNLQTVHLRGLGATAVQDLVPGFELKHGSEEDAASRSVQHFLYQNGFTSVDQVDSGGWSPVHYAALRGDPLILQGLLQQRANMDRWTRKDQPQSTNTFGSTAVGICSFFKHHQALRVLISAKAKVDGGLHPDVISAAAANDPEGIRILCAHGGNLFKKNIFRDTAFESAAAFCSPAALEELVLQAGSNLPRVSMSRSLYAAAMCQGASAELIHRLLELQADANAIVNDVTMTQRALFAAKALQHRYGHNTRGSRLAYHRYGQTPLMAAVMTAQYEGAAALIAAGARLDLRNSRNWTAADFATGHSVPKFLGEAVEGDREGCHRIAALARANACVEL